jgi:phosphohistidine swiveling domain-containing protein
MIHELATAAACHLTNGGFGEQPDCADYLHKAGGLLSDPAHITGELIFDGIETAVAFAVAWVLGRRALRKQHAILDAEHGITHHEV